MASHTRIPDGMVRYRNEEQSDKDKNKKMDLIMNKITKHTLLVIALLILLGIAGRCDYNEQVIYNMPDEVYKAMKLELGNTSESKLVDEYMSNKEYWDSKASGYGIK